jgi:hypothetical protein
MNTQMNPGGLTDDELLRLARLLQQTRGEGLAFINPGEAQMLKDAGGSGQPISGTKGFGVGGGPIRSYYDDEGYGGGSTSGTTSNSGFDPSGSYLQDPSVSGNTDTDTTGSDNNLISINQGQKAKVTSTRLGEGGEQYLVNGKWYDGIALARLQAVANLNPMHYNITEEIAKVPHITTPESQGFNTDEPSSTKPPEGWTKQANNNIVKTVGTTRVTGVPNTYGGYTFITSGPENVAGANTTQEVETMVLQQQGGSQQGGTTVNTGVVTPEQFFDEFGNSYTSQDLADAANDEISQQRFTFTDFIKGHILTDTDLETLKLGLVPPEIHKLKDKSGNPIDLTFKEYMSSVYPNLPDSELEKIFNEQKSLILKTAGPQTKQFTDKISQILQNKTETIDGVVTTIPRTQGELESLVFDDIASELAGEGNLLSEDTKRSIFQTMLNTAVRTQRFTLTPEEVAQFATTAITVDETGITDATAPTITVDDTGITEPTVGTISEVTAPTIGAYGDAVAPTLGTVDDAVAPTIGTYDPADVSAADVDEITVQDPTLVAAIGDMDETFLAEVREGENELKDILKKRISGEATSPAELQLKKATEDNLRLLLSTSAGVMDPAKLRQVRNLYSETSQVLSGQAAELRSKEQIDAEERLVRLYEQQGTRELNIAMGNLEKDKQIAIKNGDYESAAKLAIMQSETQRVITKATLKQGIEIANLKERAATAREQGNIDLAVELENAVTDRALVLAQGKIDSDTEIANLRERAQTAREQGNIDLATKLQNSANERAEVIAQAEADTAVFIEKLENAREVAIAQGRVDVAIAIANMQKDVTLATTNAEIALRSKALDNAIALASFEGQMALEGLETKVELAEFDAEVKTAIVNAGITSQENLAAQNTDLQLTLANLNTQYQQATNNTAQQSAILSAVATVISAYLGSGGSDIRLKTNIETLQEEEVLSLGEIDELLRTLKPYSFEYKDQTFGRGRRFGIMAQDLEKTELGKQFVIETPVGKMVDFGNMMGLIVASQAYLHESVR